MQHRRNEPWSSITHLVGASLSLLAGAALIIKGTLHEDAWAITAYSIFTGSMILLYLASTLYHFFKGRIVKEVFRRIDHSMIYFLIAGTYTPFCLLPLRGSWGWSLFSIIWGLAVIGITFKGVDLKVPGWLSTTVYVLMGWIILAAISPLRSTISASSLTWLIIGGLSYTLGSIFYGLGEKYPRRHAFGLHEVWHLFVMAGTVAHYISIWQLA